MKILVSGPRAFTDERFVIDHLENDIEKFPGIVHRFHMERWDELKNYEGIDEIICGGASGVDTAALSFAEKWNIKTNVFKPDYKKYADKPKYAPLARNEEMAKLCDYAVIFWSGVDGGTLYTMRCLAKEQKEFIVIGTPFESKST